MNSNSFQQIQSQSQQLTFSPQLQQSLKILQVPTLELRSVILNELNANPVLEELPYENVSLDRSEEGNREERSSIENKETNLEEDRFERLSEFDQEWDHYFSEEDPTHSDIQIAEEKRKYLFDHIVGKTSLQESLLEQVRLLDLSSNEIRALEYWIGNLDDRGYLTVSNEEVAEATGLSPEEIKHAKQTLQTLEPSGIGAEDLQHCLLIQLRQKRAVDTTAWKIVKEHYPLLLRRRVPELAKEMGMDIVEIENALAEIATLDPFPGKNFAEDLNRVVIPDVFIGKNEYGEWEVLMNHEYVPRLRLSTYYKDLIASGKLEKNERDFLREKSRAGRFLIQSIEQRLETIENIAWEILRFQKEFFEKGVAALKPLTMGQVAREIHVHETTVGRAVTDKYMDTPHGIYEMKYFFTSGYELDSGIHISNISVKERIQQIIENEDPAKPLSDQKIAALLKEENISIARRTVAKYREELNLLPTNLRRRYH